MKSGHNASEKKMCRLKNVSLATWSAGAYGGRKILPRKFYVLNRSILPPDRIDCQM